MTMTRIGSAALVVVAWVVAATAARADAPATKPAAATRSAASAYMRFVPDGKGGAHLDTATTTYENAAGAKVHLVGVVHVGERAYYEQLNKLFKGYDALLYEMIMPEGAGPPEPGEGGGGVIGGMQRGLKNLLELEYQLDVIDYKAKNFVHADLDADTFQRLQKERKESMFGLALRSTIRQMKQQAATGEGDLTGFAMMHALMSPDRALEMKYVLGTQFDKMEDEFAGLDSAAGTVIVTERNKKALAVLADTLAAGKKNVGVFYGAAHMRDMEERLAAMGFKRTGVEWRVAWEIPPGTVPTTRPAR